jgi:hypothetical protein
MKSLRLCVALFAVVLGAVDASCQTATATLRGDVADAQGAVVPGASVTLLNGATGFSRSIQSDSSGRYEFNELPPATYQLTVSAPGFATFTNENLALVVDTHAVLNVKLSVGSTTERVEINSGPAVAVSTDATLGNAFDSKQMVDLPFQGRNPAGILSLQAGVVTTGTGTANNANDTRAGAVAGARSDQANITIDGVDNNDPLQGQAFQGALRATLDSLQEFRVTTTGGNADAGRSSGAQITMVTKSGTNKFHGTAYEYYRPNNTVANDWFNKLSQIQNGEPNIPGKLIRNTFGGTVGGPIKTDRLFFFFAYEGLHQRENTQVTRTVPSANMRNGILSYICSGANCPASGVFTMSAAQLASIDPNCSTPSAGFPQGTCPLGPGANPAIETLFNQYPLPNTNSVGDGYNVRGYTFSAPAPANQNTSIFRLDYKITSNSRHQVFARANLQQDKAAGTGLNGPEFPGDAPNITTLGHNSGIVAGYTGILSANVVNSFRYGYIRQSIANNGLETSSYINFATLSPLTGENNTTRQQIPVNSFADDITWTRHSHTLGFGGDLRVLNILAQSNNGTYFTGNVTSANIQYAAIANSGQSLDPGASQFASLGLPAVSSSYGTSYDNAAIYLTGIIPSVTANYQFTKSLSLFPQGALVPRHYRSHETEFYAQDSWQIKPNLTITYGVRYTVLQTPYETTGLQVAPTISLEDFLQNRLANMQKGQPYTPLIGFNLSGQANGKAGYWPTNYGNVAPRLAFAWSPGATPGMFGRLLGGAGKSTVRGGYGMYFDHFGEALTSSFAQNGSYGLSTSLSTPPGILDPDTAPRFTGINNIPTQSAGGCAAPPCQMIPAANPSPFPVYPTTSLSSGGFATSMAIDDKTKTPYSHVVTFTYSRELPKGLVFEASYTGRFAHHLLQDEDYATPENITDPQSGMDYFTAASKLITDFRQGVPIQSIGTIPYFEDFWPTAGGPAATQLFGAYGGQCAPGTTLVAPQTNVTPTQALYNLFSCNPKNSTAAIYYADVPQVTGGPCFPACATVNGQSHPYAFWDAQYSALIGYRSIGNSAYNGLQATLRGRGKNLQFDLNYTYAHSIDMGSNAERLDYFSGGGYSGSVSASNAIPNIWNPKQNRASSDFDLRHQINANWLYNLPFGNGGRFASGVPHLVDAFIGGWQFTGIYRWSTGFPISIMPGQYWSTDANLISPAVQLAPVKTGVHMVNGNPNLFKDPTAALADFQYPLPGQSGPRNGIRGPGLFNIDTGLNKSWAIFGEQRLIFGWEVYNVTNSVRFDVLQSEYQNANEISEAGSFGNFSSTLTSPRVMEFSLRYRF